MRGGGVGVVVGACAHCGGTSCSGGTVVRGCGVGLVALATTEAEEGEQTEEREAYEGSYDGAGDPGFAAAAATA